MITLSGFHWTLSVNIEMNQVDRNAYKLKKSKYGVLDVVNCFDKGGRGLHTFCIFSFLFTSFVKMSFNWISKTFRDWISKVRRLVLRLKLNLFSEWKILLIGMSKQNLIFCLTMYSKRRLLWSPIILNEWNLQSPNKRNTYFVSKSNLGLVTSY